MRDFFTNVLVRSFTCLLTILVKFISLPMPEPTSVSKLVHPTSASGHGPTLGGSRGRRPKRLCPRLICDDGGGDDVPLWVSDNGFCCRRQHGGYSETGGFGRRLQASSPRACVAVYARVGELAQMMAAGKEIFHCHCRRNKVTNK